MSSARTSMSAIANTVYKNNTILQEQIKLLEKEECIIFHKFIESVDTNICKKIFDVQLETSYLSHWKSSIEHLILKMRQEEFQKMVTEQEKQKTVTGQENTELQNQIEHLIKSFLTRLNNGLYKIYIREKDDLPVCGSVSSDKYGAIDTIFLQKTMTNQEKRCVIAHELGHIIINRFLKENKNFKVNFTYKQKEAVANLFMYYILWDKSMFYKSEATKYSFNYIEEITDLMNIICATFGKPTRN